MNLRNHKEESPDHSSWTKEHVESIAEGPLYYYIGAGLSTGVGLVGWNEMACVLWRYLEGYERKADLGPCPENVAEQTQAFLDRFVKEKNDYAQRILSRESGQQRTPDRRAFGRAALLNMLLRRHGPRYPFVSDGVRAVPSNEFKRPNGGRRLEEQDLALHRLLWQSGCHGILTSNYDLLLENAFSIAYPGTNLRSYRYTADLLRYILSNPRFVLHLHGDINDIASMEFHPTKAWNQGSLSGEGGRGEDLKEVYQAALKNGHMIYLGCGFRDETIRRLHGSGRDPNAGKKCLALVPKKELESGEILPENFPGIEFLPWKEPGEVRRFVEQVAAARDKTGCAGSPSPSDEGSDLHRQLFRDPPEKALHQSFLTELWSCKGIPKTEPQS